MKKITITIILIVLLLILIFLFLSIERTISEKEIKEYSYTRAICNSSNFCQDYDISCSNNQAINIIPITGAVIQHDEDWVDFRNNSDLC